MSKKGKSTNVRSVARQLVLSSFRDSVQPRDVYSDGSKKVIPKQDASCKFNWQQKSYRISFDIIIKETSVDSHKHVYEVSLNDDANLLVSTYSERSKKTTSESVAIPQKKSKSKKVALVYGVHTDGKLSFPHTPGQNSISGIADFYSFLLGQINDAIQYRLLQQREQKTNDDSRERDEGTQPQENVGEHQEAGRRKKVLPKIRAKALPKETTILVETDGEVLGSGYPNIVNELGSERMDSFDGTGLEGVTLEF